MTVHMQVLVSAFAIASILSLESRNAAGGELQKVSTVIRPRVAAERIASRETWHGSRIAFSSGQVKNGQGSVASATRRLDLSALTMADFGDVEPAR